MKKFFAELYAKLTGGATAPTTLAAAKATFVEAVAALDRVGALFTNAGIELDALLAKGENGLKDFVTALKDQVAAAEAKVTEATGKVTTAEAATVEANGKVSALNSQIAAFGVLFASIGFKPAEVKGKDGAAATAEEQAAAFTTAFQSHVSGAVQQRCQELGVPAAKLPTANPGGEAAATESELVAALATTNDPAERGKIGKKLNALRDAKWAKN
jgi:hypothetical protein